MKRYNKIYILTPANYVTGGVECCFQLAEAINKQGTNCYTVFTADVKDPVPTEYKKYKIKITNQVEDSGDNLFIVPEIFTHLTENKDFREIKFAIWWLSVDHNRGTFNGFKNTRILHLCQSYYAEDFLKQHDATKVKLLLDPIHENYTNQEIDLSKKDNQICYSIKGKDFAERIKPYFPDYKFVMLQGMTRDQVVETLKESKLFIDFGYHPGRDKIPREAVALMNCLITNRKGAANYKTDIPIPDEYKFLSETDPLIIEKIRYCIENYETAIQDFQEYRDVIKNQSYEFNKQISDFV